MSDMISLNGQPFRLHRWGSQDAPPVLLLHGFPEYGGAWAELAAHLPGWRCIAPDQRGYGGSYAPDPVEAYGLRELVADMAALIESIGGPVPVVGHDWGAVVAYGLAIWRPDLVSHLVVINGPHPGPFQRDAAAGGAQSAALGYFAYLRAEGAEDRLAADGFARLRRLFAEGMDMTWLTGARLDAYRRAWTGRVRGMVNWYRASPLQVAEPGRPISEPHVLPPEAGRVACPHLVIWGMEDRVLLPGLLEGLEAYCPDLTIERVPGADHWICHQRPAQVAGVIDGWLRGRGVGIEV